MGENYISCREENGSINISEDVISEIVRSTVTETEGVSGIAMGAGSEIAGMIGLKTGNRGVTVRFSDGRVTVDVMIMVSYGHNVVSTARKVQEAVQSVVHSTTGFEAGDVNVSVTGISFEK